MQKLIVGISGSPKKNGHNERQIKRVLEKFSELGYDTKEIFINSLKVSPCIACNYCKDHGECFQKDDGNKVNSILKDADAIIVSTPVYFGGMSGQLKCMLDRTLPLRRADFKLKGKVGAAIAIGGSRNGGQEIAIMDIHSWMMIQGMVIVGDDSHFGGIMQAYTEDKVGKSTVDEMITAVDNLLKRLK